MHTREGPSKPGRTPKVPFIALIKILGALHVCGQTLFFNSGLYSCYLYKGGGGGGGGVGGGWGHMVHDE